MNGPFMVEKLERPVNNTRTFAATNLPECDFTIAQKLARRWLKHQQIQDSLSRYGVSTPMTELEVMQQSYPNKSNTEMRQPQVNKSKTQRSTSRTNGAMARPALKTEQRSFCCEHKSKSSNRNQRTLPLMRRECDTLLHQSRQVSPRKEDELASAKLEIQQMRRAIKFYTDRLIELKTTKTTNQSKMEKERLSGRDKERCLNAQMSRQLYALTRQLSQHTPPLAGHPCDRKPSKLSSAEQSLQQLSSIHKSVIRCLESFVSRHDQQAIEERHRQQERRSPSPLPPAPLPSTQLYAQLCTLLEQLSASYAQYGSVCGQDPELTAEFVEAIKQLQPPAKIISRKSQSPQSKKPNVGSIHRSSSTTSNRVRFEKHESEVKRHRTASFKNVKSAKNVKSSFQQRPVCPKSLSTSPYEENSPHSRPLVSSPKKQSRRAEDPTLLKRLLTSSPSRTVSTDVYKSPSPARHRSSSPAGRYGGKKICEVVLEDTHLIVNRLRRIELETMRIRQRWQSRNRPSPSLEGDHRLIPELSYDDGNVVPYLAVTDKLHCLTMANVELETGKKLEPEPRPVNDSVRVPPAPSPSPYLEKIVDIVQNRLLDGLINESFAAEMDRLETIANRLIDHLLQGELMVASVD